MSLALIVSLAAVTDVEDVDNALSVIDGVYDTPIASTNPPSCRFSFELLNADGARCARQGFDLTDNTCGNVGRQPVDLFDGGGLDDELILSHELQAACGVQGAA